MPLLVRSVECVSLVCWTGRTEEPLHGRLGLPCKWRVTEVKEEHPSNTQQEKGEGVDELSVKDMSRSGAQDEAGRRRRRRQAVKQSTLYLFQPLYASRRYGTSSKTRASRDR